MINQERHIDQELQAILPAIMEAFTNNPPTIGLIGVSGVGKSSTLNRLFRAQQAVSDMVACTKTFEQVPIEIAVTKGLDKDQRVQLCVIDAPGLGEDIACDPEYLALYRQHLEKCDVILWIMSARQRAVALDQQYLYELKPFAHKMVFGLNQIDLVEPMNWAHSINLPSEVQERNIDTIMQDRKARIESVLQSEVKMVAYSSKYGYHLQELFTLLITACPPERSWLFDCLQGFHYKQLIAQHMGSPAAGDTLPAWQSKLIVWLSWLLRLLAQPEGMVKAEH